MSVTAHCVIKNEEIFIPYAIASIIDFVDHLFIYDTGSTDGTVKKIEALRERYPEKIHFEQKGPADKKRHTELRQEMLDRTETDWFMILDGDEVWTARALKEAGEIMKSQSDVQCIVAPFYLCVGDVYHRYFKRGEMRVVDKTDFLAVRFVKKIGGVHWRGDFIGDSLFNGKEEPFENKKNTVFLNAKYWHLTHLRRSFQDDQDYSSGGVRASKRRLTYFLIGRKINEPVPDVFMDGTQPPLDPVTSFINFVKLVLFKLHIRSSL